MMGGPWQTCSQRVDGMGGPPDFLLAFAVDEKYDDGIINGISWKSTN